MGGEWPHDFSVSPSSLGTNLVFELGWTSLGLGLGVFGIRVWGQGLTINRIDLPVRNFSPSI